MNCTTKNLYVFDAFHAIIFLRTKTKGPPPRCLSQGRPTPPILDPPLNVYNHIDQ